MEIEKMNDFFTILTTGAINTVYQPIISLVNGSILGYEALSRIAISRCVLNIEDLFKVAAQQHKLWELKQLCRSKSPRKCYKQTAEYKTIY